MEMHGQVDYLSESQQEKLARLQNDGYKFYEALQALNVSIEDTISCKYYFCAFSINNIR
jgi:hypothetical protein